MRLMGKGKGRKGSEIEKGRIITGSLDGDLMVSRTHSDESKPRQASDDRPSAGAGPIPRLGET